jgi:hypothetical protein
MHIPTGDLADRATSSLPRTESQDGQSNHDEDGNDETAMAIVRALMGVSKPLGINRRPYSVRRSPLLAG